LIADENVSRLNFVRVGSFLANFSCGCLLIFLTSADYQAPIFAVIAGKITMFCILLWTMRQEFMRLNWRRILDIETCKKLFSYGKHIVGTTAIGFMKNQIAFVFTALWLSNSQVALYKISYGVLEKFGLLPRTLSTLLLPRLASSSEKLAFRKAEMLLRTLLLLTLGPTLFVWLFAEYFVTLIYGKAYEGVVPVLRIMAPVIAAMTCNRIVNVTLNGMGKPHLPFWLSTEALVVSFVMSVLLIPRFGISGAAMVVTFVEIQSIILSLLVYKNLAGCRLADVLVPRVSDFRVIIQTFR
jgi:O-antigen/teichoic acid export membrane protein